LELEKARPGEERCHKLAQVIIVSSEWVKSSLPPACRSDPVAALLAVASMELEAGTSGDCWQFADGTVVILTNGSDGTYVAPRIAELRSGAAVSAISAVNGFHRRFDELCRAPIVHVDALSLSKAWLEAGDSIGAGDSFAAGLVQAASSTWSHAPASKLGGLHELVWAVSTASFVAAAKLASTDFAAIPAKLSTLVELNP
jgi:sugar/nucleoside kinase (ribokinase family)